MPNTKSAERNERSRREPESLRLLSAEEARQTEGGYWFSSIYSLNLQYGRQSSLGIVQMMG